MERSHHSRKETFTLIVTLLVIFFLMYFLEIRRTGYFVQDFSFSEVSECKSFSTANRVYAVQQDLASSSTCFFITGDNVTLDFGGHVLEGDGDWGDYGIVVEGAAGTLVKNGIIKNFQTGIFFNHSQQGAVSDIQLEHHADSGIFLAGSSDIFVRDTLLLYNGYYGGKVVAGAENTFLRNTFYENEDSGLSIQGSLRNTITSNVFGRNAWNGLSLYKSHENILQGNRAHDNLWNGLSLTLSSQNSISDMALEGNRRGIYLFSGDQNLFSHLDIAGSLEESIFLSHARFNLFRDISIRSTGDYTISLISSGSEKTEGNVFQDIFVEEVSSSFLAGQALLVSLPGVYSRAGRASSNTDNVFLNVDYARESITPSPSNELVRKWWLEIFVTDKGKPVQVRVEIQDHLGNLEVLETNAEGYLKKDLVAYVKSAEKKESYSYHITVAAGGKQLSKILKMNENKKEVFRF